ncbi:hypothetical protein [Desulfosarcina cetonica]|uniref:hypothetical protein n=1 Tax=Desulfosarcina cetonica TaxID=90730 RepID=UPI0012ED25C7|nr:hypothetical protein [Desulfosarcina cetonica]
MKDCSPEPAQPDRGCLVMKVAVNLLLLWRLRAQQWGNNQPDAWTALHSFRRQGPMQSIGTTENRKKLMEYRKFLHHQRIRLYFLILRSRKKLPKKRKNIHVFKLVWP